jgi:hypothetical protein
MQGREDLLSQVKSRPYARLLIYVTRTCGHEVILRLPSTQCVIQVTDFEASVSNARSPTSDGTSHRAGKLDFSPSMNSLGMRERESADEDRYLVHPYHIKCSSNLFDYHIFFLSFDMLSTISLPPGFVPLFRALLWERPLQPSATPTKSPQT